MQIQLEGLGKRFQKEWIFRNVDLQLNNNNKYAIIGHNGSGKSTLLQSIVGLTLPSEGSVSYSVDTQTYDLEKITPYFSFSAPYQELPEELTGNEIYNFHFTFRSKTHSYEASQFFEFIGLSNQHHKLVKYYSSGMKQRLRLGLCLFTQAKAYFLDEPSTNLDKKGIEWYKKIIQQQTTDKLLIISSNIPEEYELCNSIIDILDYKPPHERKNF